MDHCLDEHFEDRRIVTRVALVAAVLLGAALGLPYDGNELPVDIATALLAGFMMFQIFGEELPRAGEARFGWFLVGAGAMLGSVLLTD